MGAAAAAAAAAEVESMWKGTDNCHYWMADMAAYLYFAY
jgi:hypothetical protein